MSIERAPVPARSAPHAPRVIALAWLVLFAVQACAPEPSMPEAAGTAAPATEAGAPVDAAAPARRIVSLAPHLTELTFTAGAGERLVGAVEYSDFPPAARALPRVGDAFRIDMETLAALDPDLVLAWQGGNPAALIDQLRARGYRVETLATGALEDIADNLRRIGKLSGRSRTAEAAAQRYLDALDTLRRAHRGVAPRRVFVQIAEQPLYTVTGAHAIGQVVELCGGRNVFASLPGLAAAVDVEAVLAADPQVILASGDATQLAHWRRFPELAAVAADALYGTDADLLTRDSTRILQGAAQVCAHLEDARRRSGE